MTTFFQRVEQILKDQNEHRIGVLEYYNGLDLKLYEQSYDEDTSVYGRTAGSTLNYIEDFRGIIINDDFFETDDLYSGSFTEGFLYTRNTNVKPGSVVEIVSQDGRTRRFKIISKLAVGTTTNILSRFSIVSLGN